MANKKRGGGEMKKLKNKKTKKVKALKIWEKPPTPSDYGFVSDCLLTIKRKIS